MLRQWYYFWGREGFFRAALHYQNDVTEISFSKLQKKTSAWISKYDVIVFDFLCNKQNRKTNFEALREGLKKLNNIPASIPRALLVANAAAFNLPDNEIMDYFDIVFKREPFKDRSKYSMSEKNINKIHPTMISCHFVPASRFNLKKIQPSESGFSEPADDFKYEVSFIGTETSDERIKVVETLLESDYNFFGGLREKRSELPDKLKAKRLNKKDYIRTIRNTKINLALEGCGEFTYRHLELWWACAFMISSPSINELELPMDVEDGVHYITYESEDDLLEKIDYYLEHPEERKQIALNGRKAFEEGYDFEKHGEYITRQLKALT
jgi:hypothetical protein